jgi:hypothetical protein
MKTQFQAMCLIAFLLVFSLSATFSQEKTNVTLGGSYWNAAYTWEDENGNKIADIGTGNMLGPYATISHGKWNFGASALFGSFPIDKYEESGVYSLLLPGNLYNVEYLIDYANLDLSRSDLNFSLGYRLNPYINVFAGLKYINWSIQASGRGQFDFYDSNYFFIDTLYPDVEREISEKGLMYGLGISGVLPFGTGGWYGFASLSGMGGTLDFKHDLTYTGEISDKVNEAYDVSAALAALNLGIGYRMPSGFGINAGYRADLFSEDAQDSQDNPRIHVQGLILTASYSF